MNWDFEQECFDGKSNTYFLDRNTEFIERFTTSANIVVFGDVTCDKLLSAANIIVFGNITSYSSVKAERIFCTNLYGNKKIVCNTLIADDEINADILIADTVRCENLNVIKEIKARKITSNVTQIYKGQKIECKELHTYKYYN